MESEITAQGPRGSAALLLSTTLAGCWLDFPVPRSLSRDHAAGYLPAPDSAAEPEAASIPTRLTPWALEPAFSRHLLYPCFCRYCTEDSPSFPRPSLLESHISLMHGIRNPDLSQTSKGRPPGGRSPQVSRGPCALGGLPRSPGAGGEVGGPQGAHL